MQPTGYVLRFFVWHQRRLMRGVGTKNMRINKNKFLIPIVLLCLTGCGTFNGNIKFKNDSNREIWVARVLGFEGNASCGVLIPQAHKSASLHRMKFPTEVTLYWSYKWGGDNQKTILNLSAIKPPEGYSEIVFIFSPEEKWHVTTESY